MTWHPLPAELAIMFLFFSVNFMLSVIKLLGPTVNSFSYKYVPFTFTGVYSMLFSSFKLKVICNIMINHQNPLTEGLVRN